MEMKRRNVTEKNVIEFKNNIVKIERESNQEIFFEIRNEITTDMAEAIAIMINMDIEGVWNLEVDPYITDINPEKCLYWLSGGREWITLEHYNRPWVNCYIDFQNEFGYMVMQIIKKSKTLGDIKKEFIKYLNLPILYDFAISKGFVR